MNPVEKNIVRFKKYELFSQKKTFSHFKRKYFKLTHDICAAIAFENGTFGFW